MINLIPKKEKERLMKDFYLRIFIVFFVMLAIVAIIASIAISPSYVLSINRVNFISLKLQEVKNQPVPDLDKTTEVTLQELEQELNLLNEAQKNDYLITEKVIDKILAKKTTGIKITKISYEKTSIEDKKIEISGIARDREDLLVFRRSFEKDDSFQKVDLPISNFVQGSNIIFYLSLMPA